jgi:hypothetical protein
MKRAVSVFMLAAIFFVYVPMASAGFEVVPAYNYTGSTPPIIQSTPTLQATLPEKNIFIQEPATIQAQNNIALGNNTTKYPNSSLQTTNNAYSNFRPSMANMSAEEVKELSKSLNHITFIGSIPASIPVLLSSGSNSNLSEGIKYIASPGFNVYLYPSVQKKYGKSPVRWYSGERWLLSLDRTLDAYHLKAVIDWKDYKIYVSEQQEKIIPAIATTTNANQIIQQPQVINKTAPLVVTTNKSPFLTNKTNPVSPQHVLNYKILPVPVVNMVPVHLVNWTSKTGVLLSDMITEWTNKQGWKLFWRSDKDYNIVTPFTVTTRDNSDIGFLEAMKKVFALYDNAKYPFKVNAYPEQKILIVTLKGDNKAQ